MEALIRETAETTARRRTYAELVERHAPLVKRIARHLSARMPASVQLDDLVQAGMIGLLEAARKFDVDKGAGFETFSGIRIRGAMLDEIRRGDWGPRSVYRNSRRVSEATRAVESQLGRDSRNAEVAAEMDISIEEYFNIIQDLRGCRLFSYEDMFDSEESRFLRRSNNNAPEFDLHVEKFRKALRKAIETLTEREQLVLNLYYEKELNLKEIGKVLGVSESRVSQIHSQAALRLKARLQNWA